METPKKEIQV